MPDNPIQLCEHCGTKAGHLIRCGHCKLWEQIQGERRAKKDAEEFDALLKGAFGGEAEDAG